MRRRVQHVWWRRAGKLPTGPQERHQVACQAVTVVRQDNASRFCGSEEAGQLALHQARAVLVEVATDAGVPDHARKGNPVQALQLLARVLVRDSTAKLKQTLPK